MSIPLADSGTGISQALAILYVVVTAEMQWVIVIDEPNTFSHSEAVKHLLSIMRELDHQSVITTHSSDIIRKCCICAAAVMTTTLRVAGSKDAGQLRIEIDHEIGEVARFGNALAMAAWSIGAVDYPGT